MYALVPMEKIYHKPKLRLKFVLNCLENQSHVGEMIYMGWLICQFIIFAGVIIRGRFVP